jgi:hypothetical protein
VTISDEGIPREVLASLRVKLKSKQLWWNEELCTSNQGAPKRVARGAAFLRLQSKKNKRIAAEKYSNQYTSPRQVRRGDTCRPGLLI